MGNEVEVYDAKPIMNPTEEMKYGADAAGKLLEVVRKAGLAKKFGGEKEHLYYEAWQTVGKFYGASAKTKVDPIIVHGIEGAKASAELVDPDGCVVGGAEAYCMRDEANWRNKPWFQLASMAQTRAGSKAFRNKFAFVASLAGFATTPAEEMDSIGDRTVPPAHTPSQEHPQSDKNYKEMQNDITMMLSDLCGKDENAMMKMLADITTWKTKDGEVKEGKTDPYKLNTKENAKGQSQTSVTHAKIKKVWQEAGFSEPEEE